MKGRVRYHFALKFALTNVNLKEGDSIPITATHPVVVEAASRYRLHPAQIRRLISDLRKVRDGSL